MELVNKIVSFINEIGIECREGAIADKTFLPGIEIQHGAIIYDPAQMKHPGDLLHEAGHLAVLLPEQRKTVYGDNPTGDFGEPAAEMSAIAWSWAALSYLELAPEVVFHEHGYAGSSKNLIACFSEGKNVGAPILQWLGMTKEPKYDIAADEYTYPKMKQWLRSAK